jgi:hypothetical protein
MEYALLPRIPKARECCLHQNQKQGVSDFLAGMCRPPAVSLPSNSVSLALFSYWQASILSAVNKIRVAEFFQRL